MIMGRVFKYDTLSFFVKAGGFFMLKALIYRS